MSRNTWLTMALLLALGVAGLCCLGLGTALVVVWLRAEGGLWPSAQLQTFPVQAPANAPRMPPDNFDDLARFFSMSARRLGPDGYEVEQVGSSLPARPAPLRTQARLLTATSSAPDQISGLGDEVARSLDKLADKLERIDLKNADIDSTAGMHSFATATMSGSVDSAIMSLVGMMAAPGAQTELRRSAAFELIEAIEDFHAAGVQFHEILMEDYAEKRPQIPTAFLDTHFLQTGVYGSADQLSFRFGGDQPITDVVLGVRFREGALHTHGPFAIYHFESLRPGDRVEMTLSAGYQINGKTYLRTTVEDPTRIELALWSREALATGSLNYTSADKQANLSWAEANVPATPVNIKLRWALLDSSAVAILTNTSAEPLKSLRVELIPPNQKPISTTIPLLQPQGQTEIGWAQGFPIKVGDTLRITAPEHLPATVLLSDK